jgi:predicted transglutaminase-like cysteine proteinase
MTRSCYSSALHRRRLSAIAVMSSVCWAASAQAVALEADGSASLAPACESVTPFVPQPAAPAVQVTAQSSKSAAILGAQVSALEQILIAQQSEPAASDLAVMEPAPATPLAPAIGGTRPYASQCFAPRQAQATVLGADDFLASRRLEIGRTTFDSDWQRVSRDRVSSRRYRKLVGSASPDSFSALRSINSWVNQAITFTEDRDLFSRADYWAGAATTLRLRRGDCEDIALTKMQLLAAAGIDREDMILTIARDLVRNADHAVLIVRHDGRYYMLDNASDEVFDASESHDYRPILSFGSGQAWLHGY